MTTRREILGMAAGAVAAGTLDPSENEAKQEMWAQTPRNIPAGPPQQLIDKCRRFARGEFLEGEARDNVPMGACDPYEQLKSVSRAAKYLFQRQKYERDWKRRAMENARKALLEYDRTGFLGHIF